MVPASAYIGYILVDRLLLMAVALYIYSGMRTAGTCSHPQFYFLEVFMESKSRYFLSYTSFDGHYPVSFGVLPFYWDHPYGKSVSPKDWLIWAHDICMDYDFATLFICGIDSFGDPEVLPVFCKQYGRCLLATYLGYDFVPVVDPSFEEFDIFKDSYGAYVHAAQCCSVSVTGEIRFFKNQICKDFLKEEGDL